MKLIYLIWYPFPYKYYLKLAIRYSCTGVAVTDQHLHENSSTAFLTSLSSFDCKLKLEKRIKKNHPLSLLGSLMTSWFTAPRLGRAEYYGIQPGFYYRYHNWDRTHVLTSFTAQVRSLS